MNSPVVLLYIVSVDTLTTFIHSYPGLGNHLYDHDLELFIG